jgi:hypothetical protein
VDGDRGIVHRLDDHALTVGLDARRPAWNDPLAMPRPRTPLVIAALFGAALGAGGLAALAEPPKGGYAPDPVAKPSRDQWIFEISARGGKVAIDSVTPQTFAKPAETPRVVGRFALELYIGRELLDRVRFDVPLMGAENTVGNRNNLPKPRFDQNVTAHVKARMADNPRAAYLLIVDRETGDSQKLLWPPEKDGRVRLWTSGLSDAAPGDFPEGGVRAAGLRDGGPAEAGPAAR